MSNYDGNWLTELTDEQFDNFLVHTFDDPTRTNYKNYINEIVGEEPIDLAEIGVGQGMDFYSIINLITSKQIHYTGYESSPIHHEHLCRKHPGFNFLKENFWASKKCYDWIYVRHVLEHQPPECMYPYFFSLLRRSRVGCIITWFVSPGNELIQKKQDTGEWVNQYDKTKLNRMLLENGCRIEKIYKSDQSEMWIIKHG